jgi:shikimate kinase
MQNNIILIGYMGSGKSSVAEILSKKMSLNWYDLDALIENKEEKSVSEIINTKGEIYFRKLERTILTAVINKNEPYILSLGGGTPCYGDNLEYIHKSGATTVYLKADIDTLTKRLFTEKSHRPLIAHLQDKAALNDFIRKHLFERAFYYNQAKTKITTDGKSLEEIADEILKKFLV